MRRIERSAPSIPPTCFFHELRHKRAIGSQPARCNRAALHGGNDGAAGLAQMLTVVELALTQIRFELDKAAREVLWFHMDKAEFLQPRRIDDMTVNSKMREPCMRRRMTPAPKCRRQVRNARGRIRQQSIDDSRLSHARLSDQPAGVSGEACAQRGNIYFRRELHHFVAQPGV